VSYAGVRQVTSACQSGLRKQRMEVKEIIEELTRLRNGGSYNPDKTSEAIAKAIEVIQDWKARRFRQDLVNAVNRWNG